VLAGDALEMVHNHGNILDSLPKTQSTGLIYAETFIFHSVAKLATLKFLCARKKLPPLALKQKDPGFGRFSQSSFEQRFAF
jgi:hypothetical protein